MPLIRALGRLSYPVYLNHYILGPVLVAALAALGLPRGAVLALALSAVLLVSYLVMAYPERVLQSAFKNEMHRWHRGREVAATAP